MAGSPTSILPAVLPFTLGYTDAATQMTSEFKKARHKIFRRVLMKRRLTSGEYESTWQEIPESKIIKYGKVRMAIDKERLNFFSQSGVDLEVVNLDGYFNDEYSQDSFWFGYMTPYRTLVRYECGYLLAEGTDQEEEIPTGAIQIFTGIIADEIELAFDNTAKIPIMALSTVFDEINAGDIDLSGLATGTAQAHVQLVRDHADANGVKLFQKYITLGGWNIATTTADYTYLTTSTALKSMSMLDMLNQFAESEGFVFYMSGGGDFNFVPRNPTATSTFHFQGGARYFNQPHSIIKVDYYRPAFRKIKNRVRIKFNDASAETSYYTAAESWVFGDSSTSFRFGVKTLEFKNTWLSSVSAQSLGDALLAEYKDLKNEISMDVKFSPHVHLLDRITISHNVQRVGQMTVWGSAVWGSSIWSGASNQAQEFNSVDFYVIGLTHDVDQFYTSIHAREVDA